MSKLFVYTLTQNQTASPVSFPFRRSLTRCLLVAGCFAVGALSSISPAQAQSNRASDRDAGDIVGSDEGDVLGSDEGDVLDVVLENFWEMIDPPDERHALSAEEERLLVQLYAIDPVLTLALLEVADEMDRRDAQFSRNMGSLRTPGNRVGFNPQPEPPGHVVGFNPQPQPPGHIVGFNPQPQPPGHVVGFNPQPQPPGHVVGFNPQPQPPGYPVGIDPMGP